MPSVSDFFNVGPVPEVGELASALNLAIRDARTISGRDAVTGEVLPNASQFPAKWSGTLVYLVSLELMALAWEYSKHGGNEPKSGKRFKDFLKQHGVKKADANDLWALRCCFAHQYGLVPLSNGKHAFVACWGTGTRLFDRPDPLGKTHQHNVVPRDQKIVVDLAKVCEEAERVLECAKRKSVNWNNCQGDPIFTERFFIALS